MVVGARAAWKLERKNTYALSSFRGRKKRGGWSTKATK